MSAESLAVELLKRLEGLRLDAYQDEAGVWTIGYGHTGPEVKPGVHWTKEQADQTLEREVGRYAAAVRTGIGRASPFTDNQLAALISFTYNVGIAAFINSTLHSRLAMGLLADVPSQMLRWVHIHAPDGSIRISEGLSKRRTQEVNMWKGIQT